MMRFTSESSSGGVVERSFEFDVNGELGALLRAPPRQGARVKFPPLVPSSTDAVLRVCQAALRQLTGAHEDLPVTKRLVSEEEIPDDRPTQTPVTKYTWEIRLGDRVAFQCIAEVGGWSQGFYDWSTADFAGTGRLTLSFDNTGVTIDAARAVVEIFATLLKR